MNFRNFCIALALLLVASNSGFSQHKVKTSKIKLTVPKFHGNEGDDSSLLLVKNNVLKPIRQSDAILELRMYFEGVNMVRTVVIKCTKDSVFADRYVTYFYTKGHRPTKDTSIYKELAITDKELAGMYKKLSLKLPSDMDWQLFLKQLIVENHLFELPDQAALNKIKSLKFIDGSGNRYFQRTKYDLYVNGQYRSFEQNKALGYVSNTKVPAISYYKNIRTLVNKLTAPNEKTIDN